MEKFILQLHCTVYLLFSEQRSSVLIELTIIAPSVKDSSLHPESWMLTAKLTGPGEELELVIVR